MLTHEKLVDLYRELRQDKVLSVYLDVDQHDPAERNTWRIRLDQQVSRTRKALDGDNEDRHHFEQAWKRLRERLDGFGNAFVPQRGWVGFATPEQVLYAENLPVPMPDGVYWEEGIRVAPYVRGLKQERPVVIVLIDSQRARVFRYMSGDLTELQDLRADTFVGDVTDVNVSKRATNRSGVRGKTGTEQAQSVLDVSSHRMLKHLMGVISDLVGAHGFVLLGGVGEMVSQARQALSHEMQARTTEATSLHLEMTDAEVKHAAEDAATVITRHVQQDLLATVLDAAGGGGRACLGRDETLRALEEMRVDTLLLSRALIARDPDLADRCVGAAFAQGAAVEELSGPGADTLDQEGDGLGARLRYKVRATGDGTASHTPGDEGDHQV